MQNRRRFGWFSGRRASQAAASHLADGLCALSSVPTGVQCSIAQLPEGRGIRERLMDMGLTVGRSVEVLRTSITRGPVVILVGQTRLALGHEMAAAVVVKI